MKHSIRDIAIILSFCTTIVDAQNVKWIQLHGPLGDGDASMDIYALLRIDDSTFVAGTNNGIYQTTNAGVQWIQRDIGLRNIYVLSLTCSNDTIFAGTFGHGIFRSPMKGTVWEECNNGILPEWGSTSNRRDVYTLQFSQSTGLLFAGGTHGRIYRSADLGDSWDTLRAFGLRWDIRMLYESRNGVLFASDASSSGLFASTDQGISWIRSDSGMFSGVQGIVEDSFGTLFAASGSQCYASFDGGRHWIDRSDSLPGWHIFSIGIGPDNRLYLGYERTGRLYYSDDQGQQWDISDLPYQAPTNAVTVIQATDRILLLGTWNGILASTDQGRTWEARNRGLVYASPNSMVELKPYEYIVSTSHDGIFRSSDGGKSWGKRSDGFRVTGSWALSKQNDGTLFSASWPGLYRSVDSATSWKQMEPGSFLWVTSLATYPPGFVVMATDNATDSIAFYSTDNGDSWQRIIGGISNHAVSAMKYDESGKLYVATAEGMFVSYDHGQTLTPINTGLRVKKILCFDILPDRTLLAGTKAGLFLSADAGASWSEHSSGLVQDTLTSVIRVTGNASGTLFAALSHYPPIDFGVWMSLDRGINWENISEGLTFRLPRCFFIDQAGYLYCGLERGGLFRTEKTTLSVKRTQSIIGYALYQNFPNPFNPSTTVSFDLPRKTTISLEIYDSIGRRVKSVLEGDSREPGTHSVILSSEDLSSGVYFYRLVTSDVVLSRPMVILK